MSILAEAPSQASKSTTVSSVERARWIFAGTIFLSAFLLFQVQLIVSKYILPWFGGSSAVWTTNIFVFQVLLLAGYLYSHFLSEHFSRRAQGKILDLHSTFWLPCLIAAGSVTTAAFIGSWVPSFGALLQSTYFYAWSFLAAALLLSGAYMRRTSSAREPWFPLPATRRRHHCRFWAVVSLG